MSTDTIVRPSSATLDRLLDEELEWSPSFGGRYSTHLAMSLIALHEMGAPAAVLEANFAAHDELEPRDDREVLAERREEVARDGIAATVRRRGAALVHGPHSQLFHPLIRLAYALDVGHEGQVAAALLDWERRHQTLAEGIALDTRTLDDVSSFAIAAHATADDFITLHLVTGARAVRAVSGWLDEDAALRLAAHALPAMADAYAAVGAPPLLNADELDGLRRSRLPSREAVAERAIASTDPHVIKLANVALVEEARTGDLLYRYVAARVVDLLPPMA